jgi:hypothetical protein
MVEQNAGVTPGGDLQLVGREDELMIDFLDRASPCQMGMRIDHAGHHSAALTVDHDVGVDGINGGVIMQDRSDMVAFDKDRARDRRAARSVEDHDVTDQLPHSPSLPENSCGTAYAPYWH